MYKNEVFVEKDRISSFIDITNTSPVYLEIVFDDKETEPLFAGPGESWNVDCGEKRIADDIFESKSFSVREVSELRAKVIKLLEHTRWYLCSDGFGGFILRHITPSLHSFEFKWPMEEEETLEKFKGIIEYCSCPHNSKKMIKKGWREMSEEELTEDAKAMAKECIALLSLLDNLQELKTGAQVCCAPSKTKENLYAK